MTSIGSSASASSSAARFALEVAGENKIGRDALVEPAPALDAAEGLRGPVECCFAERRRRRIGDERGDEDGRHDASRRGANQVKRALLIAGPTASGKSAAALALARKFGATIVNADSMQVYADLQDPDRAADAAKRSGLRRTACSA